MMRSGNPALSEKTFQGQATFSAEAPDAMTLEGTAAKTLLLLGIVVLVAGLVWWQVYPALETGSEVVQPTDQIRTVSAVPGSVMGYVFGGAIAGLIFALIIAFKPTTAPMLSPIYAACEGLFLGAFSAMFEYMYPGIVLQAVALTFGTMATLLVVYRLGIIKATENFKLGIVAATGGIFLVYLVTIILGFFGITVPLIHQTGWIGIGFSVFVVIIAALNLVLDFDFIETGVERGAPRYMEWYGAFGLMVTLVWLYIELLRLLAKLRD